MAEPRIVFENAVWEFANLCANHSYQLAEQTSDNPVSRRTLDHYKALEDAALKKVMELYDAKSGQAATIFCLLLSALLVTALVVAKTVLR